MNVEVVDEADAPFKEAFCLSPVRKLEERTPYCHVIPYLFLLFYDKFGFKEDGLHSRKLDHVWGITFKVDSDKLSGQKGWFVCFNPGGQCYELFFSEHMPLHFADSKAHSLLALCAGYHYHGAPLVSNENLRHSEAVFDIKGPCFRGSLSVKGSFEREFFMLKFLEENILKDENLHQWLRKRKLLFNQEKHLG